MRNAASTLLPMIIGLGLVLALSASEPRAEAPVKTVVGTVERAEVTRGEVRSVYIKDAEQRKFLVVRSTEMGKKLLKHVGETVRATGHLKKARPDSGYTKLIDVLEFEIVTSEQATVRQG